MKQRNRSNAICVISLLIATSIAPFGLAFSSHHVISRRKGSQQDSRRSIALTRASPILLMALPSTSEPEPTVEEEMPLLLESPMTMTVQNTTKELELAGDACIIADPQEDAQLWPWRILLLAVTGLWGANFAIVKQAADALASPEAITLFTAGRFVMGAVLLSPALLQTSSMNVVKAGVTVGVLTTVGYAAQVAAVSMGTQAGTAAFICSLNAVVVAVMIGQKTGCVSPRTWWAIGLSVLGVACLELPAVLAAGDGGFCLGDVVAFGQPLGFGASYVWLEQSLADHPEDELPLAALQVLVTCTAALVAACVAYGGTPLWELPWSTLLPNNNIVAGQQLDWTVAGPLIYSGAITSALTIWLQALVFSKLPAVDASLLLTTEPLWAVLTAVWLLGDVIGLNDVGGGSLILLALMVQQGLLFNGNDGTPDVGPRLTYDMTTTIPSATTTTTTATPKASE